MSALSVRGLTIAHGGRLVVEDVSFSAQAGAVTAILGNEGAGKTMLLSGISGLLKCARGAVLVGGADVTTLRPAKRGIGMLPPGTDLGRDRTALVALRRLAGRRAAPVPDDVLAGLGYDPIKTLRLGDATHGQALAILAASRLLQAGCVLLVDEAGSGLTESAQDLLMAWLRAEAARGRAILIATRNRRMALAADHLVLLDHGRVVQVGSPASVHAEPRDVGAALLTGQANVLEGTLRQKLPGGFVWMAGGMRFVQEDSAGQPTPSLGSAVALCLRPAHVELGVAVDAPNALPGVVTQLICRGPRTEFGLNCVLGHLRAETGGPPLLRVGMEITIGWSPGAASILPGPADF
jgi:ABC-type Fe3+/spermidine/putrescine transport system ATPase subunit